MPPTGLASRRAEERRERLTPVRSVLSAWARPRQPGGHRLRLLAMRAPVALGDEVHVAPVEVGWPGFPRQPPLLPKPLTLLVLEHLVAVQGVGQDQGVILGEGVGLQEKADPLVSEMVAEVIVQAEQSGIRPPGFA